MIRFPPVSAADEHGLLCISDTLSPELLWAAYRQGIFPWTDQPVGWFAPKERGLLWPSEAHFPRKLGQLWRKQGFAATFDGAPERVIAGCRHAHRAEGEWLTPAFVRAYAALAREGHVHSVEIWQGDRLVGGTYGVEVGALFAAESMFGTVPNASKAALCALVQATGALGLQVIDVQVLSPATVAAGARAVPRAAFMQLLGECQLGRALVPRAWPRRIKGVGFAAGAC